MRFKGAINTENAGITIDHTTAQQSMQGAKFIQHC